MEFLHFFLKYASSIKNADMTIQFSLNFTLENSYVFADENYLLQELLRAKGARSTTWTGCPTRTWRM